MSKIVVVWIPVAWVAAMKYLVGNDSINSSRSELVRKAIGRKLREEIRLAKINIPPEDPKDPKEIERLENQHINKIVNESMEKALNNHKLQNL